MLFTMMLVQKNRKSCRKNSLVSIIKPCPLIKVVLTPSLCVKHANQLPHWLANVFYRTAPPLVTLRRGGGALQRRTTSPPLSPQATLPAPSPDPHPGKSNNFSSECNSSTAPQPISTSCPHENDQLPCCNCKSDIPFSKYIPPSLRNFQSSLFLPLNSPTASSSKLPPPLCDSLASRFPLSFLSVTRRLPSSDTISPCPSAPPDHSIWETRSPQPLRPLSAPKPLCQRGLGRCTRHPSLSSSPKIQGSLSTSFSSLPRIHSASPATVGKETSYLGSHPNGVGTALCRDQIHVDGQHSDEGRKRGGLVPRSNCSWLLSRSSKISRRPPAESHHPDDSASVFQPPRPADFSVQCDCDPRLEG